MAAGRSLPRRATPSQSEKAVRGRIGYLFNAREEIAMRTNCMTSVRLLLPSVAYVIAGGTAHATDVTDTLTGTGAGSALINGGTGISDTATGYNSLNKTTSGSDNTATGRGALFKNTTASGNTAEGSLSMYQNTTGSENVSVGH